MKKTNQPNNIKSLSVEDKEVQSAVKTQKDLSSSTTVESTLAELEEQPKLIKSGRVPDLPGVRYQQVSPSSDKPLPKHAPK